MRALRPLTRPLVALLLHAVGALAGPRRPITGRPERVSSILVLRIDERVGNVLLTTPLLQALTSAFPSARIDVLVARSKVSLIEGMFRVIPFEKKDLFRRPWRFLGLLWRLRRTRYDVGIDASHWHTFSASSNLLLGWVAAGIRIAHGRGPKTACVTDPIDAPPEQEAEVRTKLRLMGPVASIPEATPPMCTVLGHDPLVQTKIEAWIQQEKLTGPIVGLSPGSRKVSHRMPLSVFEGLGRAAQSLGATVIVLWGPGEESLAQELAQAVSGRMAPPTNLDELATLMKRCSAIVVNDTGPMHLAVSVGAPTISLFTQPAEWRWGHNQAPHRAIAGADRSPEEILRDGREALERILS